MNKANRRALYWAVMFALGYKMLVPTWRSVRKSDTIGDNLDNARWDKVRWVPGPKKT